MLKPLHFSLCLLLFFSCGKRDKLPPINNQVDLDGTAISDSSLISPSAFLLSEAIPSPSSADLQKHVVITAHGFSATNFEWQEFASWSKSKTDLLVSRVLLGGHGRDYRDFERASWEDWQKPLIEEYNRLATLGYKDISFAASSTGCTLVLEMIAEKKISTDALHHVFLIDPIIIPSNKQLPLISVLGGTVIKYTTTPLDPGENGYWYKYRPHQALSQLDKLTRHVRKKLEKGVDLPAGIALTVYKAKRDGSADPASAVVIQRGIEAAVVKMVDSDLHVFTRLKGRSSYKSSDVELQQNTFEQIYQSL